MTPTEIIRESDGLPPMERLQVVRYAQQLETNGHLSGVELGALAQRMVDAKNPVEAARLKAEIVKDYYGDE